MITKQVQRAATQKRINGIYLVKEDGQLVGSITKPYHCRDFRAHSSITEENQTFSTLALAEQFIEDIFDNSF